MLNHSDLSAKQSTRSGTRSSDGRVGGHASEGASPAAAPSSPKSGASSSSSSSAPANKPKRRALSSKSAAVGTNLVKDVYEAGHLIPNADLCPDLGENLKIVILVTSAPNHTDARMAIRQTWGHFHRRRDISIGFVVAVSSHPLVNEAISAEQHVYGDLIQARFLDLYDHLTLKTVSMFEWVDSYCARVPFMLKTDDDMFINVPLLLSQLEKQRHAKRSMFGRLARKWKPERNAQSKYFVDKTQFKAAVYPNFLTGPAYLVTQDSVHDMYQQALNMTFLRVEDVFMTGVVAESVGVQRVHVNEFVNRRIAFNVCNVRKTISVHMVKFYEQFVLWEKLHDTRIRCK